MQKIQIIMLTRASKATFKVRGRYGVATGKVRRRYEQVSRKIASSLQHPSHAQAVCKPYRLIKVANP